MRKPVRIRTPFYAEFIDDKRVSISDKLTGLTLADLRKMQEWIGRAIAYLESR